MPYTPPPDLAGLSLAQIAALVEQQKLPPVHDWSPQIQGDSEMRITTDGRWFHQGGEITRPAMVRAFSQLLICDVNGQFWLTTPFEKLTIQVDDAPFVAVEMKQEGAGEDCRLAFRLNTDDLVVAGPAHALFLRDGPDGPLPYLNVRHGLNARLSRPVYYELAELGLSNDETDPKVWSHGHCFRIGNSHDAV